MRLGWDEIRRRAKAFSEEWADAHYEKRVESLDANKRGFIDLLWPGVLIVEQKSAGRDLLAASAQASTYFDWLPPPPTLPVLRPFDCLAGALGRHCCVRNL